MDDNYKRDIEQTEEVAGTYPAEYKHAENIMKMLIEDLKSDINNQFLNLKGTIENVEFTKKSTIWIIIISIAGVVISLLQLLSK